MSVFSKIKLSRKAAKEHKEKIEKKIEKEEVKPAYKHVPTHAAVDALSGSPSDWKHEDRSKIMAQHKRRSQMQVSRTGSSVFSVSYMNSAASPSAMGPPPLARNSSYSSYNANFFDKTEGNFIEQSGKRQKPVRVNSYHDSGIGPSPLSSQAHSEDASAVASSGNSTSSESSDHLEMATIYSRPQPAVYKEQDIFDRLHTSTTRKLGEAPLHDSIPLPSPRSTADGNSSTQEAKSKKNRWNLMGKKNARAIAS